MSHKPGEERATGPAPEPMNDPGLRGRGVRTRVLLILAVSVITLGTTMVSLLAIRLPLQNLVSQNLTSDLLHSLATFEAMQAQNMTALDRENALLADLPDLKALMTTNDERTIVDGGVEFWKVSGSDLFALAGREGEVKAAYVNGSVASDPDFRHELSRFLAARTAKYLVSSKGLYGCSVQPLYFGSRSEGVLLGYVISGFAIDRNAVTNLAAANDVQAVFRSGSRDLATSFARADRLDRTSLPSESSSAPFSVVAGGERFLAVSHDLSSKATAPLTLLELKSLDQEGRAVHQIDRLVLLAGVLALLLGAILMLALSRFVTRPLEQLATGVRAFALGDSAHILPYRGTREVRELNTAFARMRREITQASQALLESERLATIGRMASSVSHDLRHYLSAIYANSEFLASDRLPPSDRGEVLAEIRTAVDGTTEMLEALLMFSRTGTALRRTIQSIAAVAERAVHLVRVHPDAAGVTLTLTVDDPAACESFVDPKQVERAIYNLLINGCQAPRSTGTTPIVTVNISSSETEILLDVTDNGDGVPPNIRAKLFDPFVSDGKHKGTGLGLTLAQSIAAEHGGGVSLVGSRPGETIFRMTIARTACDPSAKAVSRAQAGQR